MAIKGTSWQQCHCATFSQRISSLIWIMRGGRSRLIISKIFSTSKKCRILQIAPINQQQKTQLKVGFCFVNRHFYKEDIHMASRHMKRCTILLIIREMQIKMTRRCYVTLVRMAIIKKSINNKSWWGCREKEPTYTARGNAHWRSHYGNSMQVPEKSELPHDPAILLLGTHLDKTMIPNDTCTPMVIAALWQEPRHGNNPHVHR